MGTGLLELAETGPCQVQSPEQGLVAKSMRYFL